MMVSKLLTFALYLLLIATFVQTSGSLRLGLNYLEEKTIEEIDLSQSENKSLSDENTEKDLQYSLAIKGMVEADSTDEASRLKETNGDDIEDIARVGLEEKSNSNDETQEKEKVEPNKREVLADDNSSNVGGEILHIIVLIVIVLAGIGALVAIIAFIAFLVNYIKRRINIKGGKRPGSEDILLLDNSHLPTMGSV